MEAALAAAPVVAAIGAAVFGWFCVRLSGVYLAMLTLAFAQIAWSIVVPVGRVHRRLQRHRRRLAGAVAGVADPRSISLTLVLCGGGIYLLRRDALRAVRLRAARGARLAAARDAIGIDVQRLQWLAFIVVGGVRRPRRRALRVLQGQHLARPTMAVSRSVDGLVMVLLGGVQTLSGPVSARRCSPGCRTRSRATPITGARCSARPSWRSCSCSRRASSVRCGRGRSGGRRNDARPRGRASRQVVRRRAGGARRRASTSRAGELLAHDRAERRRQDHLLQHAERPARRRRRERPARRPRGRWASRRGRSGGSASAGRSRSPRRSPR